MIGRSFALRSTTPRSSLPPTGVWQSEPEPRDVGNKKNLMILASTDDIGAINGLDIHLFVFSHPFAPALLIPLSSHVSR